MKHYENIVQQYSHNDPRIKSYTNEKRLQLLQTRLKGIMLAKGKYILTVGHEDWLEQDTLKVMCQTAIRHNGDIVHTKSNVFDEKNQNIQQDAPASKKPIRTLAPASKILEEADITTALFKGKVSDHISAKLFERRLIQQAITDSGLMDRAELQDVYIWEDILLCVLTLVAAKKYIPVKKMLYHYSGNPELLEGSKSPEQYLEIFIQASRISHWLYQYFKDYPEELFKQYLSYLAYKKINRLCDIYPGTLPFAEKHHKQLIQYHPPPKKIKRIMFHLHFLGLGGIERLVAILANHLCTEYEVYILLTVKDQNEYEVDPRVKKVYCDDLEDIPNRSYYISLHYKKINPDIVILEDHGRVHFYRDILTLKMCGACIISCEHSQYFAPHKLQFYTINYHRAIMKLANAIVVLSDWDHHIWKSQGYPNVQVILNPNTFPSTNSKNSLLEDKNILFIGRFNSRQKQPEEALYIFSGLAEEFPDWNLLMAGTGEELSFLQSLSKELGIEQRIKFLGYVADIKSLYQKTSIHLLTSSVEGFGMVITEAKSHGVPSIMYHIPNVTLVRNGIDGFVIPRRDRDEMKEKLRLLMNEIELRKKMGRSARESSNQFDIQHIIAKWKKLFQDIIANKIADFEMVGETQNSILSEVVGILDDIQIESYEAVGTIEKLKSTFYKRFRKVKSSFVIHFPFVSRILRPFYKPCTFSIKLILKLLLQGPMGAYAFTRNRLRRK